MKKAYRITRAALALALGITVGTSAMTVPMLSAQVVPPPVLPPPPLNQVVAPDINKLGVLDCSGPGMTALCGTQYAGFPITKAGKKQDLVALGKALFGEMQVGSDGIQSCASCHYHAGADHRTKNQVSPGLNRVSGTQAQIKAALTPSQLASNGDTGFSLGGPNKQLTSAQFPHPALPASAQAPNFGNNDVVSSQGVLLGNFSGESGNRIDVGIPAATDPAGFNEGGHTVRRVEPRNAPTTISSIYNTRQFWDGRANIFFNGVNPFGMLDPAAAVQTSLDGINLSAQQLMVPFSSLASQAVGPPGSDFEMSLASRPFRSIGRKLLAATTTPLARQQVATTDSALGPYAAAGPGFGLNKSYAAFIQEIFQDKFWNGPSVDGYSLMETNFALFFGLAVQAYEATLIPDNTPLDTLLTALNQTVLPNPLSPNQVERGLAVFLNAPANCVVCHAGAETTGATISTQIGFGRPLAPGVVVPEAAALTERMLMGDGNPAVYDAGFYNVGARPTGDDLSLFGRLGEVPFSFGMLQQEILRANPAVAQVNQLLLSGTLRLPGSPSNLAPVPFVITNGCAPRAANGQALGLVVGNGCQPISTKDHIGIRGAFKSSSLRNTKFTGPYFHNGGMKSLTEVLNFYNRGGDFNMAFNPQNCPPQRGRQNKANCVTGQVDFDPGILALGLTPTQLADLQHLIEVGMTDDRVAKEKAPFDHPQICIPAGHDVLGNTLLVDIPAVGAEGNAADLQTFEQALTGDTTHTHRLDVVCAMVPAPNLP